MSERSNEDKLHNKEGKEDSETTQIQDINVFSSHIKNQMKKKQEKSCEMKNESRNGDEVDRLANDTNPSRNPFSDSQKFVRQLLDASLLAANVSQLRVVIGGSSENNYFWPLIIMISLAIFCHLAFGILMIQRWRSEREARKIHANKGEIAQGKKCDCNPCLNVERCDEISMFFMLFVVALNVGIAGLGLHP